VSAIAAFVIEITRFAETGAIMSGMRRGLICLLLVCFVLSLAPVRVTGQKWEQMAVIMADVSKDETAFIVDNAEGIIVDRTIMIERRDGKLKDTYEVLHVYGRWVLTKERIEHEFPAGSRIYQ